MSKSLFDHAKSALANSQSHNSHGHSSKKGKAAQLSALLPVAKKVMREVEKKRKKH